MLLEHLLYLPDRFRIQRQRHRSRRQLRHLDDRLLADIGVDRTTAEYEMRKPFWR